MQKNNRTGYISGMLVLLLALSAVAQERPASTSRFVPDEMEDDYDPNIAPSIAGNPPALARVGTRYLFKPLARDADGDALVFTAGNLPGWISINAATGTLSGIATADDAGDYYGIVVSVSDGADSVALDPFDISVVDGSPALAAALDSVRESDLVDVSSEPSVATDQQAINLAQEYGIASQGSTFGPNTLAARVIDGEKKTSNYTQCEAGRNWLQVELPTGSTIDTIRVHNVSSWVSRLMGAEVLVSEQAYSEAPDAGVVVSTLAGVSGPQEVVLDEPPGGHFVVVKAAAANCLHITELEVFGQLPATPVPVTAEESFRLAVNAEPGAVIGVLPDKDYRGRAVSYALQGDQSMFAVDADGTLKLAGALEPNKTQRYSLQVIMSDGEQESTLPVVVELGAGNGVWLQQWTGIEGSSISQLKGSETYPGAPDQTSIVASLEMADTGQQNVGRRLITYLQPDRTGRYVFAVTGDDETELRLSTSHLASGAVTIARESWAAHKVWRRGAQSEPVALQAGSIYYLEVLHKQGNGGDHLSIGWKTEGAAEFTAIPLDLLYLDGTSVGLVEPEILSFESSVLLDNGASDGDEVVYVPAIDLQGDALSFSIDGDVPFAIDQFGVIRVQGQITASTKYAFSVDVDDGVHTSSTAVTVSSTASGATDVAVASGDAGSVTSEELLDDLNRTVAERREVHEQIRKAVFAFAEDGSKTEKSLNAINWDPTYDSLVYQPLAAGGMFPLLVSNVAVKEENSNNEILAVAGIHGSGARRALLASNIMHDMSTSSYPNGSGNAQMNSFIKNLLAWLVDRDDLDTEPFRIVVAHLADSYNFKHDNSTSSWLTVNFPKAEFNAQDSCESTRLAACLKDADLLIMGQENGDSDNHGIEFDLTSTMAAVTRAHESGLPVLYLPHDRSSNNLGEALLQYFSVTAGDNFWRHERLIAYNPHAQGMGADLPLVSIPAAINNLTSGQLDFSYDESSCSESAGSVSCDADLVTGADGASLQEAVLDGMAALNNTVKVFDLQGIDIFSLEDEYRIEKLGLLLADKFREGIKYPMDKQVTDSSEFMRAFFADHAVSYARDNNPVQQDMGLFTDAQMELGKAAGIKRTVTAIPGARGKWTSTGLYMPPGKPVKVVRTDKGDHELVLRFNMLRNTTPIWSEFGYSRPYFLASNQVRLEPDQSYTLSTPYGGPVYLWSEGTEQPVQPYSVEFDNVLANPKLEYSGIGSEQSYATTLSSSASDWVDVVTPFLEIHTHKSHLEVALDRQDGETGNGYTSIDVNNYIETLTQYMVKAPLSLAGYTGKHLPPLSAQVGRFCADTGLAAIAYDGATRNLCTDPDIHRAPAARHINADISELCGGLCTGNPIQVSGPVEPFDWDIALELARTLQASRLKVYGSQSREAVTAIYPLYANWQWARDTGLEAHPAQTLPAHGVAFELLQDEVRAGMGAGREHGLWSAAGQSATALPRLSFYMQLMYTQGGWEFFTRLHLVERIFSHAVKNRDRWATVKDLLGFRDYTHTAAASLSGNDFLYIAASMLAGKNYRDYFVAWGVKVSKTAQEQVASNGLAEQVPVEFYPIRGSLPVAMPVDTVPLDGLSEYDSSRDQIAGH